MANTLSLIDKNFNISISPGKMFINRTFKYLSPAMKLYGEEFITKMRLLSGLACAIQDYGFNLESESRKFENNIYYVIDTNGEYVFKKYVNVAKARSDFHRVLSWLRQQDYFVTDYPFDSGRHGSQHIICLKFPYPIVNEFLKGDYTSLYDKKDLDKLVSKTIMVSKKEILNPIYAVLTRDEDYLPTYLETLNNEYNTKLIADDIKHHAQFDIPPLPKNEILRW